MGEKVPDRSNPRISTVSEKTRPVASQSDTFLLAFILLLILAGQFCHINRPVLHCYPADGVALFEIEELEDLGRDGGAVAIGADGDIRFLDAEDVVGIKRDHGLHRAIRFSPVP